MRDLSQHSTAHSPDLPALDRQVLEYSRHWVLSRMYMCCTACGVGQKASEGNQRFVHDSSCPRFTGRHHPWQDLACILHWVPSENAVAV